MKTSNPVLHPHLLTQKSTTSTLHMTINGTILKTALLLALLSCSSIFIWYKFTQGEITQIQSLLKFSAPLTFILGWVNYFKPNWSAITAPIYALSQGVFIGTISSIAESFFPGVVNQAIPLTFAVLFGMLTLYSTGIIQVTKKLQSVIIASLTALLLTYLLEWILSLFSVGIPYIHQSGPIGIAFSIFVVLLASFTLLLDFEYIVQGEHSKAPKYMEWYCAYGLMVTLIWLYIEILQLLVKASRRNR